MRDIVLIDDHPVFMEGMRSLLLSLEIVDEVKVFDSIDAFIQHPDSKWTPNLVLLDLYLLSAPCWDGLRKLTHSPHSHRTAIVSASEDPADVRMAFEKGAIGFIPKSASPEAIKRAVQVLLDGGTYVPLNTMTATVTAPSDVRLTERQIDVLRVTVKGLTNKEIARELGLSVSTVKVHLNAIMRVLNVRNRTELANSDTVRRLL